MNYKNTIFLAILVNFICYSNAVHSSSDDEEEEPIQRVIAPINIEGCRAIADAISDDSARDYFESLDPEAEKQGEEEHLNWLTSYRFKGTPASATVESEEDKAIRIQKEQERRAKIEKSFIEDEFSIRDKALSIMHNHPQAQEKYLDLIRNQDIRPSTAVWELTKSMTVQPHVLALLELIEDYAQDEYDYYFGYDREHEVGLQASFFIFNYYLDEYNKRAAALPDPKQMDRSVHDLLYLCQKHIPTHPMSGIDDPECAMCHISSAVQMQLLALNLWYVDNPKLIRDLVDLYSIQRLFTLGIRFLECTTYGIIPQYFDLGYLLKKKKFVGIEMPLESNPSEYQHIWIHPYWPLQVRITQNGKLTVGLLKKNPLTADRRLTPDSIHDDNELYKISMSGLKEDAIHFSGHVIPARHLGAYQKLWAQQLEGTLKNYLMKEAHSRLKTRDMNFIGMEKHLQWVHSKASKEPETKKAKKKK